MIKFKTPLMFCVCAVGIFALTQSASAQKYTTAADTLKLNREYSEVVLDISKLNIKLVEAQNKSNGYQSKSASTAQDATSSAQRSKSAASNATDGNLADAKTAMQAAKKANNQAKDAKNAKDDENDNIKDIKKLNEKIAEKQEVLVSLDKQRAAIRALPVSL
jgi:hypothetical protein